ncbi:MAG TPA: hypothetical protein VFF54_01170 [Thermodesulfobacteriota bacterium]|nr:hypothetical protein [Thermodesulfobacteriota bacterium]
MIPRQVVERVIERVSIVEVISDYVPLHGRGRGRSYDSTIVELK